ncbi:MAG: sigma-70 family RNA polymerase sigma factor [Gemmatimonadaceae bacterium]|jgi:RNA polymerase sigma-70 factor (ECF subfamily)|nr:sigma-70 family RNA polymerase sigma factor [Gemmatimonadaceae bacterium]
MSGTLIDRDGPVQALGDAAHEGPARDLLDVACMAAGDERALAALYARWASALLAYVLRLVPERSDADEVVEETFWQAWRQAGRFTAQRGSVGAWLCTIARTRALDRMRALSRFRRVHELDGEAGERVPHDATPDRLVEATERAVRVHAALARLPPEQRDVVELAFFEGLSHREIVERTGLPLGTVKSRTRLAMQKLRERLGADAET